MIVIETEAAMKVAMEAAIGIDPDMDREVPMAKVNMTANMITTAEVVSTITATTIIVILNAEEIRMEIISMNVVTAQVPRMEEKAEAHLTMVAAMAQAQDPVVHHMEVAMAQALGMEEEVCTEVEAVATAEAADMDQEEAKDTEVALALENEAISVNGIMVQVIASHNVVTTTPALTDRNATVPETKNVAGGIKLPMKYHPGSVTRTLNADVVRTGGTMAADQRTINVPMNVLKKISTIG